MGVARAAARNSELARVAVTRSDTATAPIARSLRASGVRHRLRVDREGMIGGATSTSRRSCQCQCLRERGEVGPDATFTAGTSGTLVNCHSAASTLAGRSRVETLKLDEGWTCRSHPESSMVS